MALAIFDLDNTLLEGDSDYLWGQFLVEHNIVDGDWYEEQNQYFYDQYCAGTMDIIEFLSFQLKPLVDNTITELTCWRTSYLTDKIWPIILPAGRKLINQHRQQGDTLMIITATNSFLTKPIAAKLGIVHLIATEPEIADGVYTGKVAGTPAYQEGKVVRLKYWLDEHKKALVGSYFYSDSHNDLPLLSYVDHPVAVDPDVTLKAAAEQQGWRIISLR